jgi:nucleotide-binding universal stress UspA family protein
MPARAAERALPTLVYSASLVVVGNVGRSGLARLVLGSVATDVARSVPCSALVVRRKDE